MSSNPLKRSLDDSGGGPTGPDAKRRKFRACRTCRRQKARCEFVNAHDRCHRCSVLQIPCVFEGQAHANPLAASSAPIASSHSQSAQSGLPFPHGPPAVPSAYDNSPKQLPRPSAGSELHHASDDQIRALQRRLATIESALRACLRANRLAALETFSPQPHVQRNIQLAPLHKPQGEPSPASLHGAASSSVSAPQTMMSHRSDLPLLGSEDATWRHPVKSTYLYFHGMDGPGVDNGRPPNPCDARILLDTQGDQLLRIFQLHYGPWQCYNLGQETLTQSPFTFTVCCSLAIRHAPDFPNYEPVMISLQALLQRHLALALSTRPYTLDTIHALILLSTWPSIVTNTTGGDDAAPVPDGWLLLAAAVRIAQAMQLDRSPARVSTLRSQGHEDHPDYELALEHARIWYTIIGMDLILSIHSLRPRLVGNVNVPDPAKILQGREGMDALLLLRLQYLLQIERANKVRPPGTDEDLPRFKQDITHVLNQILALEGETQRLTLANSPIQAKRHAVYRKYATIVCLMHATGLINSVPFSRVDEQRILGAANLRGINHAELSHRSQLIISWSNRAVDLAEEVLHQSLPCEDDPSPIVSAPDHILATISFCAAILVQNQVAALRFSPQGLDRGQEYDKLIKLTIDAFDKQTLQDNAQLPRRYGEVLDTVLRQWQEQKPSLVQGAMERARIVLQPGYVAEPWPNVAYENMPGQGHSHSSLVQGPTYGSDAVGGMPPITDFTAAMMMDPGWLSSLNMDGQWV